MRWVKISMLWYLRKAEAYLEVRRAFSQAPGRERLAQIAGEGRPSQVQKDYSPTTMYDDYPISPTLFHWQSQSTTREDSPDRDPRPIMPVHL